MSDLTSTFYVHSCYISNERDDYVFVKEKDVTIESETNEIISSKNKFRIIASPKKRVWITKPQFRTHKGKKETEFVDRCDCYTVENRYVKEEVCKILGIKAGPFTKAREIFNNPYIYGADLDMESLVRLSYEKNLNHNSIEFAKGYLDIEQSVLGDKQINLITLVCDGHIYTGYLNSFMKKKVNGVMVSANKEDVIRGTNEYIGDYIEKYKFELHIEGFDREIDLIRFVLDKVHQHQLDFVGIWNMTFDIPEIIKRIENYGLDPKDSFCDKSIPKDIRRCKFLPDTNKKVAHVVDKWGWFDCTAHTQWIDLMPLFARIRRREPKREKYSLDAIAAAEIKDNKLHIAQKGHYEMQTEMFVEYTVYNIKDSLLLYLMENKNKDVDNLYRLSRSSRMKDYNKQGPLLVHSYQKFLLAMDRPSVVCSVGSEMKGEFDKYMGKVGGAVSNAQNTREIGAFCVPQLPDYNTNLIPFVADQDFASYYPSTKFAGNISQETKLASIIAIENHEPIDIEHYCSAIGAPRENSVFIGKKYYGLPGYMEMAELAKEYM